MLGGIGTSDAHGMASVTLLCFSWRFHSAFGSAFPSAPRMGGQISGSRRGWSCWALSSPPPSPAGVTWVWKNVLGPVQPLSLLSIHGVSVSRSPSSLPDFHFKLCVLYVSPDGKISERSRCTLAGKGHEWLCPMSRPAGLAPGPHRLCPGICGAQGAHKSPSKIHLLNRCGSNLYTWLASLLPSPLLP